MKNSMKALVFCAMMECSLFLTDHFKKYLSDIGFCTAADMGSFCDDNLDTTFSLLILVAAMLNRVHVRVITL